MFLLIHGSLKFGVSQLLKFINHQVLLFVVLFSALSLYSLTVKAEGSITVKPGQTIIKIMRQAYPEQRSQWPILMRELVKSNPSAFEDGDPRTLKAGSVITLPGKPAAKVNKVKRIRAASIKSIEGVVTRFDNKKKVLDINVGTIIYVGDQLLTSDSGAVTLNFIDGAIVKLRCSSLFNVDQYKMRTRGSISELSLLKGSMHHEMGRIGKRGNDKTLVMTPIAKVIAKESEYGIRVHQSQACGKQADVESDGLFVAVLNGEVLTRSGAGELTVSSGDAAMVAQRNVAPVSTQAFSGMVFGDEVVDVIAPVKSHPIARTKKTEEPEEIDNGIPVWWMIAAAVIFGISF